MSTTWYHVQQDIEAWAYQDFMDGHLTYDNLHEWARETADGCEYTIYYHHQIALWADSDYVRSFEDIIEPTNDIQQAMGLCTYIAIEEECVRVGEQTIEDCSVPHVITRYHTFRSSTGEYVTIPILDIELAAPSR